MEWLTLAAAAVAGLAAGYGICYWQNRRAGGESNLQQQLEETQTAFDSYRQQVQQQLETTNSLMQQMAESHQQVLAHLQSTRDLLSQQQQHPAFPFFSEEATAVLQAKARSSDASAATETATEQPRDYSGNPSGVFSADSQPNPR